MTSELQWCRISWVRHLLVTWRSVEIAWWTVQRVGATLCEREQPLWWQWGPCHRAASPRGPSLLHCGGKSQELAQQVWLPPRHPGKPSTQPEQYKVPRASSSLPPLPSTRAQQVFLSVGTQGWAASSSWAQQAGCSSSATNPSSPGAPEEGWPCKDWPALNQSRFLDRLN